MRYTIMIAIVLVAGCAIGGERIYNLITHRADPSGYLYADAQSSSNIATHISGNPFGVAPETLANIVGAGLQSAFAHTSVTFVTRPTEDVRRNMVMVIAFDPSVGTKSSARRAPDRTPWAPSIETVRAMMAFCFGDAPRNRPRPASAIKSCRRHETVSESMRADVSSKAKRLTRSGAWGTNSCAT